MKYIPPVAILFIVATLIFCSSCKKSSNPAIAGTWRLYETARDENNNLKIDTNEATTVISQIYYKFNSDGSGSISGPGQPYTQLLNWKLMANNQLQIIYPTTIPDTVLMHIDNISGQTLTLSYATSGTLNWLLFYKD